jgi:hypothetical protein
VLIFKNGFPLLSYGIIHNNGWFSSTQLLHSHAYKGVVGYVVQHLVPKVFGNLDTGKVMLGLLPNSMLIVGVVLGLAAIVSMVLLFIYYVIPHARKIHTKVGRGAYVSLFILVSFVILKSIFDGGIFDFETAAALPFFILILGDHSKTSKIIAASIIGGYHVFVAGLFLVGYFPGVANYTYHIFATNAAFLLFLVIYAIYVQGFKRLTVLIMLLAAVPFFFQIYNGSGAIKYVDMELKASTTAYVASYVPIEDEEYSLITKIGLISLYKFMSHNKAHVRDVVGKAVSSANVSPISIPWQTCNPSGRNQSYAFDLTTPTMLKNLDETNKLYALHAVLTDNPLKNKKIQNFGYHIVMSIKPCMMVMPINIVEEIVSQQVPISVMYRLNTLQDELSDL